MTPGEIIVIIVLVLAGAWIASKVLGLVWEVIGGPVSAAFWYFFEVRYPDEDEEELPRYVPPTVKRLVPENMSTPEQTKPDQQTDRPDRRASVALPGDPKLCPALRLDKTKGGLITLLVYNEWTVSEIRAALKGDNTVLSQEIAEARQRLGLEQPAPYRTPIAGREVKRDLFYPDEPELEYKAP